MTLSGGDMRRVINILQSTWLAFGSVTEENVYACVGHPLPIDIKNILNWLLNETYENTYNSILFDRALNLLKNKDFFLTLPSKFQFFLEIKIIFLGDIIKIVPTRSNYFFLSTEHRSQRSENTKRSRPPGHYHRVTHDGKKK